VNATYFRQEKVSGQRYRALNGEELRKLPSPRRLSVWNMGGRGNPVCREAWQGRRNDTARSELWGICSRATMAGIWWDGDSRPVQVR